MSADQRVEAAARAYYEWATLNDGEASRWDEPGPHQGFARARAEVMLTAADAVDPLRVP